MDERYEAAPEEIPIEEFTLEELAEEEIPEGLSPSEAPPEAPEPEPAPPEEPEPVWEEGWDEYTGKRQRLLTRKGRLRHPGWAAADTFEYNKESIRHPSRRKEWERYLLFNSRYAFQVTYGNAGWAGLAGVTLVDFATGERFSSGKRKLFPGDTLDLDFSGGQPHSLKYEDDDLFLSISFDGEVRRILVRSDRFDADLSCHDAGDAMVTVTPFALRSQFCYRYKKVFRDLAGHLYMHNVNQRLDGETFLLLDSVRGVLPYRNGWIWAAGARETDRGVLALNLGTGFGSEDAPSENAIFLDGKMQKLGRVFFKFSPEDYMRPWRISDAAHRIHLTFRPAFEDRSDRNYLLVHDRRRQLFGKLSGTVRLQSGETIRLDELPFFVEHAVNRG